MFVGEIISLFVALSWTVTALFAEVASKRMGSLPLNVVRMTMSLSLLVLTLWLTMGTPSPRFADGSTWLWLLLSGVVGYVIGDYCLMQGYIYIGSRFGQLFMTLSAPTAAITGRLVRHRGRGIGCGCGRVDVAAFRITAAALVRTIQL